MRLDQQFYWYNGNGGNCSFNTNTASGAYVFNPLNNTAVPIKIETKNVTIYRGLTFFQTFIQNLLQLGAY